MVSKPVSGDAAEQRLKTEVMQLPPRDRRRIKGIPEVREIEARILHIATLQCTARTAGQLLYAACIHANNPSAIQTIHHQQN